MTLLPFVLLVVAAWAVAVRIVRSRSTVGVALTGVVVLGAIAVMAWCFSDALPPFTQAQAADVDRADAESPTLTEDGGEIPAASAAVDASPSAEEPGEPTLEIKTGTLDPPPPDWVESEDVLTGDTQLVVVTTGPYERESDCRRSLDEEVDKAVNAYVDRYLGKVYGDNFKASTFVNYDRSYIENNLLKETYTGKRTFSFGPMYEMYALLKFEPAFRADLDGRCGEIDEHWRQLKVAGRLTGTALAFGFILALLGVVFGYFRLDTATRGYYTGRLKFASAVVILTLIVVGVLLARHFL